MDGQEHFCKLVLQKVSSMSSVFPECGLSPKSNAAVKKHIFSLQYNVFGQYDNLITEMHFTIIL